MRRFSIWIIILSLSALASMFVYGLVRDKDDFVRSQLIGQKLPIFSAPAIVPNMLGFSNTDMGMGKPRLLNLFGSWCPPCIAEAPQLEALRAQGAEIYGIALRDTPAGLKQFLQNNGNPFARIGSDQAQRIQLLLGSTGVPETFVISANGTIIYQHIGEIRNEDVPMLLAKLKEAK
jgi:cytochrome c biogenesis protein CcmG, thiol:disulfide interchange protein DsbE